MKAVDIIIALVLAIVIFIIGAEYMAYVIEGRRTKADQQALGLKNV